VALIITTYQQRTSTKPHVPSTTYGLATLGANGAPNTLFIAFLFSDHEVGVHLLKDVELIPSSIV